MTQEVGGDGVMGDGAAACPAKCGGVVAESVDGVFAHISNFRKDVVLGHEAR